MKDLIVVRGGGDLATGTIHKLVKCGFCVLVLEVENPSAIRRNVSFSEAVYQGQHTVENMTCFKAESVLQAKSFIEQGRLTILTDPYGKAILQLKPLAVVDAIIAKKNLGTNKSMAPITVALGPGFVAGTDVDAVVETKRGHNLGRVIWQGGAQPNTGIPGIIAGYGKERVIHSPEKGILSNVCKITDVVTKGQTIAVVKTDNGDTPVLATIDGILRGLIRDGYPVTKGLKIADIDPRKDEVQNCFSISDKARCIAGGVVEAIMQLKGERGL